MNEVTVRAAYEGQLWINGELTYKGDVISKMTKMYGDYLATIEVLGDYWLIGTQHLTYSPHAPVADTQAVLALIAQERQRQDAKWGTVRHLESSFWLTILQEELGEVARGLLENHDSEQVTHELVQCAAVIAAWIEDRQRDSERATAIGLSEYVEDTYTNKTNSQR